MKARRQLTHFRIFKAIGKRTTRQKNGGHTYYGPKDFTKEEIARKNPLAVAVLNDGMRICKYCGGNKKTKPDHDLPEIWYIKDEE